MLAAPAPGEERLKRLRPARRRRERRGHEAAILALFEDALVELPQILRMDFDEGDHVWIADQRDRNLQP